MICTEMCKCHVTDGFGLVFKSGFDQLSTDTVKVRKPTVLDMEGGDDDGGR